MSLVVDASAVVALLAGGSTGSTLRGILRGHDLNAPHLLPFEVLNSLRGLELARKISQAEAVDALERFSQLRLELADAAPLRDGIWGLRGRVTSYDASYVVLACRLNCSLVTLDARLARAVDDVCRVVVP